MRRIRIGNDINLKVSVTRNGKKEDFTEKTVSVFLNGPTHSFPISSFNINGNEITFSFPGSMQKDCGDYTVTVKQEWEDNQNISDTFVAFKLVERSYMAGGTDKYDVYVESIDTETNISTGEGADDYQFLSGKPKINDVVLVGNKTLHEIGAQPEGDYALKEEIPDISGLVEKEKGKSLSSNDFTKELKQKLEDIKSGADKLGDLSNVGNWANIAPTKDRILVQLKGDVIWRSITLDLLTQKIGDVVAIKIVRSDDDVEGTDDDVFSSLRTLKEIATNNEVLKKLFLRRDVPDQAAEIIDFLKGLTVNGDKASIDEDGIATVQQLIALVKAQIAALEVTGNTKTNSLDVTETAKAKDVEVSDTVTTLNAVIQALAKTHDLTVENTADIMNGIIRKYLTSDSFVSGFLGSGFKIWKDENGLWHGELDELTVRKTFLVFELVVQKIVHQGGMVIRSAAGGKLKKVTDGGTYWKCEHDSTDDFVVGDQVLCQTFTGTSMKRYWRLVTSAGAGYFNLSKSDCETGSANPEAGDEVAVLGNRTVTARQKAQIDCAVGDDAPYRDDYSGISSYSLVGKLINRTGNLSGITDPDFGALSGSGLYGINVYLKGIFRLLSGKTVETAISDAQAESNAYTDGKITKIETSFEIREGQISSKVTEATTAAKNADSSATLAQGYASTATSKASAASNSASSAAGSATTAGQKASAAAGSAADAKSAADNASDILSQVTTKESSINQTAGNITLQVQEVTTKVTTATNAANTASTKASEASTSAGTASTKASAAATSADTASTKASAASGSASAAATSATNASNSASSAASSASAATNVLTTVTQKETSINQTADAIELKAVRAESAAGRAESAEASINLKADGIVLQASNQAAKTAVDGVQIGGRNLLKASLINSSLWPAVSSSVRRFSTVLTQDITAGKEYCFSFYAAAANAGDFLYLTLTNETGNWDFRYTAVVYPSDTNYHIYTGTARASTNIAAGNVLGFYQESGSKSCAVKWVMLVEGNKATDWTPAPEDVTQDATDKANTAESNAKQYANNTFTTKTTYEAEIQILSGQISSKVSQTDFNSLGATVSSHTSTINQLPTTIDQRITSQVADGGIIKTNVESWFTMSGNTISLGAKSVNISGATVFSSLATQSQAQGYAKTAVDGVQVGGRNLLLNSKIATTSNFSSDGDNYQYYENITCQLDAGVQYIVSGICPIELTWSNVHLSVGSINAVLWLRGDDGSYQIISSSTTGTIGTLFTVSKTQKYTLRTNVYKSGQYIFSEIKIERGTKATQWTPAPEDVSQDATNKALAAQSNAISVASTDATTKVTTSQTALATQLGYSSYAEMAAQAAAGKTIINGGYINTSLINANAIITNELLATKIAATDITTRRLTVGEGCMVGGFSIGSGRIGISASPENIGNSGMFLYADMIGFNSTNRQAIVGTYSILGYPRLGQFIDTTSNYMPNVGLVFDINSTNNGGRNYAFVGRGNGVLNGFMCGYAFQELSFTKANQWQEISKLTSVVGIYGNYNNWAVVLPTFASVCNALNIGYNTPFVFQITVLCTSAVDSGKLYGRSNSGISGISGYEYPELHDWNNGIDNGGYVMGAGNSFQIVLFGQNNGTSSIPVASGSYRAYIVNKLS